MVGERRNAERTRQALLVAAGRLFAARGFDATRVDDLAGAAGVNKRMIYAYFGNKRDLYRAVLEHRLAGVLASAQEVIGADQDPADQVENLIRWYFHFLQHDQELVRLLAWEALRPDSWESSAQVDAGIRQLGRVVRAGAEAGAFDPELDADHLVLLVHSACLGFFSQRQQLGDRWKRDFADPRQAERVLDDLVHMVLDGIRRRT